MRKLITYLVIAIASIETLYEQYLYKDDFCKMLMDLVKEMSDAAP